jgi:hypothetical protein
VMVPSKIDSPIWGIRTSVGMECFSPREKTVNAPGRMNGAKNDYKSA